MIMRKVLPFMLVFALAALLSAQEWQTVKVGDMEYYPNDGFFVNADTGLYVGADGVVVGTFDGAASAVVLREPDGSGRSWKDVQFANDSVAYACGRGGVIYKTVNGGYAWHLVADTANFSDELDGIAVVSENVVYAAGKNATLLKTTDGGATWEKSDFSFEAGGKSQDLDGGIAFCNENVGVVIPDGTGGYSWYTHDGGATWNFVQLEYPSAAASTRSFDVAAGGDSTVLIVGYNHCKFLSKDGGATYSLTGDFVPGYTATYYSAGVINENTFVAGGKNGYVEITRDGGATWSNISIPSGRTIQFIDFIDTNNGYVFAHDGQWFKTIDGGITWTPILDWPNCSFWGLAFPSENKIVLTSWGGGEMTISEDGGATWSYPDNRATGSVNNLYECEFADENNGLIAGSYGDLRRTTDGGQSWTLIDNPMYEGTNLHINALHYLSHDVVLAGGSKGNIMKSTDGGQTWTSLVNEGKKTVYDFWPVSSKQVIASASSGQIYISNAAIDSFKLAKDYGSMLMRAVEFRGDVGLVVASSGYIFRTTVAKWDTLEEVFREPDHDDFYDLEFVTDSLVFTVGRHGKIYRSEDAGQTWTKEDSVTNETLHKVRFDGNKLWAVGADGTILSLDLTPPATPITGLYINEFMASNDAAYADENGEYDDWIEIYNSNDHAVDIGGLYITDDLQDPTNWQIPATAPDTTTIPAGGFLVLWADKQPEQGVLHCKIKLSGSGEQIGLVQVIDSDTTFIDSLTFGDQTTDISRGRLTDGGSEWGFFSKASPGETNANGILVGIGDDPRQVVQEYRLAQNFPNPFNPTTTIEFSLKKAGRTTLTVYSLTGQKIATLIDGEMKAGSAKIVWDASQIASGVYFYKLVSGNFSSVRKMLLLK